MSVKSSVEPINLNGTLFTNSDKADLFNNLLVSQTALNEPFLLPTINKINNYNHIPVLITQPVDIYKILLILDVGQTCRPHGLSNKLLKTAPLPFAQPLSELFNFILSSGIYSDIWKTGQVTTLFKKGDKTLCNNCCPISLLPCISIGLEKTLFEQIEKAGRPLRSALRGRRL